MMKTCCSLLLQAMAPDGGSLLVGNSKGRLQRYDIVRQPAGVGAAGGAAAAAAGGQQQAQQLGIDEGSKRELKCPGSCHSDTIDCMVSLAGVEAAAAAAPQSQFAVSRAHAPCSSCLPACWLC